MTWDFAEANPFASSSGSFAKHVASTCKVIATSLGGTVQGWADQGDASTGVDFGGKLREQPILSTDPPYYDNIGYADLSDYLYVWLRYSLKPVFPHLFATVAVPKTGELVATPYRHGSKEKAESFFLDGMTQVIDPPPV